MNKTELTKGRITGYGFACDDTNLIGMTGVLLTTSPHIRKIRRLFPTTQIFDECFSESGMGECYIQCDLSPDFKQISSITYHIHEFKYEYDAVINGEDIFNDTELCLIKDEVKRVLDNYQWIRIHIDLGKSRKNLYDTYFRKKRQNRK